MPETDLNIILRVIDNASADFKKVNAEAIRSVNELKDSQRGANNAVVSSNNEAKASTDRITRATEFYKLQADQLGSSLTFVKRELAIFNQEITKGAVLTDEQKRRYQELQNEVEKLNPKMSNLQEQIKKQSREFATLKSSLIGVTIALGIMVKGLNDAAEYNEDAKKTLDGFNTSLKTLSATIGVTFEPAIQGLTYLIDGFRLVIEAALAGFVKMFSFVFEYLSQLPSAFKNVFDNIKAVFTGDDPIGIVEGFRLSFDRALQVADLAADQMLNKIETTRARIETGRTVKNEADEVKAQEELKQKTKKKTAEVERELKQQAITDTKAMFAQLAEENKAFAIINQGIAVVESIINTAQGVTKALASANIPLAIAIGVLGAAKTAVIASQKFHEGGMIGGGLRSDEVPIIAQTGEAILSRRGVANIGGEQGVNRINDGGGLGGGSVEVNVYYPKMSKAEEVKELAGVLGLEIEKQMRYARGI